MKSSWFGMFAFWRHRESRQQEKMEADVSLPNLEKMCASSLDLYLEEYFILLTDLDRPFGLSVVKVAGEIERIYRSLQCPLAIMSSRWGSIVERAQPQLPQVTLCIN